MSGSMYHTQADCKQMDWHQALEPWSALVRTDPRNCALIAPLQNSRAFSLHPGPKQGRRAALALWLFWLLLRTHA